MTKLIGFTGLPGSKKHKALRLTQEYLEAQGYSVSKYSISWELNTEVTELIPLLQANEDMTIRKNWGLSLSEIARLKEFTQEDMGVVHPDWGYNRSNDNVRKIMSSFALMRRERDEGVYLERMMNRMRTENLHYALCADLRFPNEVDAFIENNGIVIHCELDQEMLNLHYEENQSESKYNQNIVSNDPVEMALDHYTRFTLVTDIYSFDIESIGVVFLEMENFNFEDII